MAKYKRNHKLPNYATLSQIKRVFVITLLKKDKTKQENLDALVSMMAEHSTTMTTKKQAMDWFENSWEKNVWEW